MDSLFDRVFNTMQNKPKKASERVPFSLCECRKKNGDGMLTRADDVERACHIHPKTNSPADRAPHPTPAPPRKTHPSTTQDHPNAAPNHPSAAQDQRKPGAPANPPQIPTICRLRRAFPPNPPTRDPRKTLSARPHLGDSAGPLGRPPGSSRAFCLSLSRPPGHASGRPFSYPDASRLRSPAGSSPRSLRSWGRLRGPHTPSLAVRFGVPALCSCPHSVNPSPVSGGVASARLAAPLTHARVPLRRPWRVVPSRLWTRLAGAVHGGQSRLVLFTFVKRYAPADSLGNMPTMSSPVK